MAILQTVQIAAGAIVHTSVLLFEFFHAKKSFLKNLAAFHELAGSEYVLNFQPRLNFS